MSPDMQRLEKLLREVEPKPDVFYPYCNRCGYPHEPGKCTRI